MSDLKLIVGLGNPGRKYDGTRHNVGFQVIAELHERFGKPRPSSKFESELVQVSTANHKVILQSPLTFMNLSGKSVRGASDFYKIPVDQILVICDDFNLDLGRLRFRPKGSAGGQNGLKDIIQRLGTQEFARLRLGVGKPPENWDVANYVLSKFRDDEQADLGKMIKRAADSVVVWLDEGTQKAMNRFNADPNQKPKPPKPKSPKAKSPKQNSPKASNTEQPADPSSADKRAKQPEKSNGGLADNPPIDNV